MAGAKETPRQKMIGMMYLVLTALLALNVSKEVLNSFVVINGGLETTNENFSEKNQSIYAAFEKAYGMNQDKVGANYRKAKEVKEMADSLYEHIQALKEYLVIKTDSRDSLEVAQIKHDWYSIIDNPPDNSWFKAKAKYDSTFDLMYVGKKSDFDIPTTIMIGGNPETPKEGPWTAHELKLKLQYYRDKLKQITRQNPILVSSLEQNFSVGSLIKPEKGDKEITWQQHNFYYIPVVACVTNLSKIQADIRNAESDVVKYLLSQVDAADFKFDRLEAKVIPTKGTYVLQGEDYEAEILVMAYSTTKDPDIDLGKTDTTNKSAPKIIGEPDNTGLEIRDGVGHYKVRGSSEGEQKFSGIIKMQDPSGAWQSYEFHDKYTVAKPSLVVSPTKMNVFYIGVENPVAISAAGMDSEKLNARISGQGSIKRDRGSKSTKSDWLVSVNGGKDCKVVVTAEVDGEKKNMGDVPFRVKRVPNPEAKVLGKTSGLISRNELISAGAVIPKMPESFMFDLYFSITEFTMTLNVGQDLIPYHVKGNKWSPQMISSIKKLKKGAKVYIEDIKAKGPDGIRKLSPMALKIR